MKISTLAPNIYCVGSKDKNRQLFDNLMHLPEGTSYNAHLIVGSEKTALIDTVYAPCYQEIINKLQALNITNIDYIILNHAEQDHTGALPDLLKLYPNAKIITNKKCQQITMDFLPISADKYQIINDNDELSLGDKTLQFIFAPFVHWPETMFSFLKEDKILFSTDFFGAHATNYDVFCNDEQALIPFIKAYYAEIMMPYASVWQKYLPKIRALSPKIITPCHGPAHKNTDFIIDLYESFCQQKNKGKMVILSVSMYGSTTKMLDLFTESLKSKNIPFVIYDVVDLNTNDLVQDLIDCAGLVIASPTVLNGPHPMLAAPLFLINALKPALSYIGLIGSYSWGTQIEKQVQSILFNYKNTPFLPPVLCKGTPKLEAMTQLATLADSFMPYHTKK